MILRIRTAALAVTCAALAMASSANAATQIGETFAPTGSCTANATYLQGASPGGQYTAQLAGIITSWSYRAGASPPAQLRFKVGRNTTGQNYVIVGHSDQKTPLPNIVNTYTDIRLPIQAGDVIGIHTSSGSDCLRAGGGYTYFGAFGDVAVGLEVLYGMSPGQLDVSATLEADGDGDGFGDETQDNCPGVPNPAQADSDGDGIGNECEPPETPEPPDTTPPDTTITKHPKDKTKKKTATFEFTSSEAGSTFECKLEDDVGYSPCESPVSVKVGKGKHSFQVRATDASGNTDPTPASDDWKVKKKKR